MAGRVMRSSVRWIGLVTVLLTACTSSDAAPSPTPVPITVTVNGVAHQAAPGTTFGALVRALHLRPSAGRLLSVSGDVLDAKAYPGSIDLNGQQASRHTTLATADSITVTDGVDRTEGTKKVDTVLSGRHPADPQYSLRTYPMREIDTVGRVSGDVASSRFKPIGKAKVPGEVALTFDDGPWPRSTRQVLKVLKRHHVHATFFMIGENIVKWPAIARDVVKAGMTVGNHSWDHVQTPVFSKLEPHRLQTEFTMANHALAKVGVDHPFLFRSPGGSIDANVVQEARAQHLRVVQWDVDPQDWRSDRTAKEIAHTVLANVKPGSIVDMHDGGGDQRATVKALPMIIRGIRKMGLKLVAIPR